MDEWQNFKIVSWTVFLAFTVLSIYGGICLGWVRKSYVVKQAKVIIWLSGPVLHVVVNGLVPVLFFGPAGFADSKTAGVFIGQLIGLLIGVTIWTLYLGKSKRVANTYRACPAS